MKKLLMQVTDELLPELVVESLDPHDPVVVKELPRPWTCLGRGNYAAVLLHPEYPEYAVKVYAPGRPGLEEELEVYRLLGRHPAYSECYASGSNFLIMKRLKGLTVYECIRRGIRIPEQVIRDIDEALDYARSKALYPHDIHAKNVMMENGRGYVLDVSDFLKQSYCGMWKDFKKVYFRLYAPLMRRHPIPVPDGLLEIIRKGYQLWKKIKRSD